MGCRHIAAEGEGGFQRALKGALGRGLGPVLLRVRFLELKGLYASWGLAGGYGLYRASKTGLKARKFGFRAQFGFLNYKLIQKLKFFTLETASLQSDFQVLNENSVL